MPAAVGCLWSKSVSMRSLCVWLKKLVLKVNISWLFFIPTSNFVVSVCCAQLEYDDAMWLRNRMMIRSQNRAETCMS